jgi:hypothetical protein
VACKTRDKSASFGKARGTNRFILAVGFRMGGHVLVTNSLAVRCPPTNICRLSVQGSVHHCRHPISNSGTKTFCRTTTSSLSDIVYHITFLKTVETLVSVDAIRR